MKNQVLFFLILFAFSAQSQVEKPKTALLIGVGDYAKNTGWQPLHSKNDIELIKGTLLKKGFAEADIFTLIDSDATFSGIKTAIENFEKRTAKNGIAYFHFSGHGQQTEDDNGDEIDGLDEAFVPYNSPKFFDNETYHGDSLIRDDLLEKHFLSIRKKLGSNGHLLVTVDACRSGTSTRGLTVGRGTDVLMAREDFVLKKEVEKAFFNKKSTENKLKKPAPIVSIFSSGADQLSYETQGGEKEYGIFTYAFCNEILNSKTDETYQSLFLKIKHAVSLQTRRQIPQIEGIDNALIFDGALREELTHFPVREMITNDLVLLDAGSLSGLRAGTEVVFFSSKITDTVGQKPIAEGIIDEVTPFDADVRLSELTEVDLAGSKVFIRKQNFGSIALNLKLTLDSKQEENQLKNALLPYPFLKFSGEKPDLFLDKNVGFAGSGNYELLSADETILSEFDPSTDSLPDLAAELALIAGQYAQSQFLKRLELASFELNPVAGLLRENEEGTFDLIADGAAKEGETVKIKIKNEGEMGFYFSVIDITPDHKSALLIPYGKPAADFFLPPGGQYLSEEFEVAPPYGTEVLKIIATAEPLDLKRYIETRSGYKSAANPLEILLSQTFFPGQLTRGQTASVYLGESSISSFIFEILR